MRRPGLCTRRGSWVAVRVKVRGTCSGQRSCKRVGLARCKRMGSDFIYFFFTGKASRVVNERTGWINRKRGGGEGRG